jgi:preprotein translocase subunit SecD
MKIRWDRFNIYLLVFLAACLTVGCQSVEGKRKKQIAILRVHMETVPDASNRTQPITLHRASPVAVVITKTPFLTEQSVKAARVIDSIGGFAVQIEFNRQGKWLLEQHTGAYQNNRVAVFATFGINDKGDVAYQRWLAAPKFSHAIADGILTFTPDATREEANELVLGLNNAAKKYKDFAGWRMSSTE